MFACWFSDVDEGSLGSEVEGREEENAWRNSLTTSGKPWSLASPEAFPPRPRRA